MKRIALIIIGHFKPEWNSLTEEEQAAFATQVGRTARKAGVTPVVGYKLTTQGSFLQVYEADDKQTLERFMGELDALGYKKYYDQALMLGERSGNWIATEAGPSGASETTPADAPQAQLEERTSPERRGSKLREAAPVASGAASPSSRKKAEATKKTR